MNTLTVKITDQLGEMLEEVVEAEHLTKSEIVRRAISSYLLQNRENSEFTSALERSGDLVGCFEGQTEDLSSNPDHMAEFGRV